MGIHSHTFRMRGNGSDISCFFLLVLHFNSPHHAILNGNRFGNTIPKCDPPCVRVAYSEYRIGFGTSIQCLKFHIQICCERQRTIYFILHKRKIKLSFIRIPNNMYKKPQATPLDEHGARVREKSNMRTAVFSWHVEWRCEHLCACIL